jgi:hypothetical protein
MPALSQIAGAACRLAAAHLHDDSNWFHLHGTGVFYRQR